MVVLLICAPWNRHLLMGVINLNKPSGPTSHEVTAWVKAILETRESRVIPVLWIPV